MSALYLITGFLGTGKTTFLQHFVRQFQGQTLAILVNEFGKAGVDGALLQNYAADLKEIAGGSIFCSCKLETFELELSNLLKKKPDVVLIEASGLADPTTIWKLLRTRPAFAGVDYRGCICLCDAVSFPKVLKTARPCKKQLSVCDVVILNKLDLATPVQLQETHTAIIGQRPDVPILETSFGKLEGAQIELCLRPKLVGDDRPAVVTADLTLRTTTLKISKEMTSSSLSKYLQMFCEDCYRIKGFVCLADGDFLVNCVGAWIEVVPSDMVSGDENFITVLHTSNQKTKGAIQSTQAWYPNLTEII